MSLLDDARRLVCTPWIRQDGYAECANCGASRQPDEDRDIVHNPDCPWLAMPKIVAALEAAQGLDEVLKAWPEGLDIYGIWSDWSEQAKPKIQVLVAALKGDVVP